LFIFFFQAEDGIRDGHVTGVQTCALPIFLLDRLLKDGEISENLDTPQSIAFLQVVRHIHPELKDVQQTVEQEVRQEKLKAKIARSEERRVGKECRCRGGTYE